MDGGIFAWCRPADAAAAGLIVLAAGSLAARLCRQPVRRARIIVLTLLGAVAVPALGALPVVPRWSAGLLPPSAPAPSRGDGGAPGAVSLPRPPVAAGPDGSIIEATPARPTAVAAGTGPATAPAWRWEAPGPGAVAAGAYVVASAGFAAWWIIGQMRLWRIARSARPAPGSVRDVLIGLAGPDGARVVLLESGRIDLPLTYTRARPVILLPSSLCDGGEPEALRYALAHEWSHVERHDARAWNLACLAGLILFYQPLFWWLRRQLRLCQDYLADARAAAAGSAEDYAAYLVRLARQRRARMAPPALGIGGRRSNLYRRVTMLVLDRKPLERRCRTAWSFAAASIAAAVVVAASGLRLDAAPQDGKPAPGDAKAPVAAGKVEGARTWKGRIGEKGTGKPIGGAEVVVEISLSRDKATGEPRTLREVPRTTGPDGAYEFTVTPEEAAEPLLYITLHVKARDHVAYYGGYSYGMILKNETLGERPFYENLELAPGKAIEAVVKTPEGRPAAGVKIQSFSAPNPDRIFHDGRFSEARTNDRGHFRLVLHPAGKAVFWILPQDYAPETHGLKGDLRGDLGTITLEPGVRLGGRLLDARGEPVGGAYVEADRERMRDDGDAVPPNVADQIHRATVTGPDGTYAFRPLPPGTYRVRPTEQGWDPSTRDDAHDPVWRPLPAVFATRKVTLRKGETPDPVEIRAMPQVVVEVQTLNSKGEKRGGHVITLVGRIGGEFWSAECQPTADGAYRMIAPHGLEDAQILLMTNEHSALQFRTAKDAPLEHGRNIALGTLDRDKRGIEIVRYEAPIILIDAKTKDGQPIKGFQPSVDYASPGANREGKYILKGDVRSDVGFEEQADGKFRTSQLVPDREVVVTAQAEGYATASRKMSLPEGKIEEVTFVLEPK